MLEIEKLEREWRRYKMKRLKPWFLFALSILLISGVATWVGKEDIVRAFEASGKESGAQQIAGRAEESPSGVNTHSSGSGEKTPEEESGKQAAEPESANGLENVKLQSPSKPLSASVTDEKVSDKSTPAANEPDVTLNADTDFLKSFDRIETVSSSKKRKETVKPASERAIHENNGKIAKGSTEEIRESKEESFVQDRERSTSGIQIVATKVNNTLKHLIAKFNRTNDPKLASYIAQSYYKKGDYKEALKWSVTANSLDPSSEETWLVYARSKVKLGRKEEAIKALRIYLNQYNSRRAKSYLKSLESGR
ncbi:transformation system protein [Hydrogenimonas sp.]|nr:transformation system protein [Hydrogenimonas sp.]